MVISPPILQYLTQKLKVQHVNLHSTLLSLDNNDNVVGKFIAEFDIIKAMIGVDEELLMDSLNYIDNRGKLIYRHRFGGQMIAHLN